MPQNSPFRGLGGRVVIYFFINFLSVSVHTDIFSSNSYLYPSRLIFFRQFLICIHPDYYYSVNFLSVSIQTIIIPSIFYLYPSRLIFFCHFLICIYPDQYFFAKLFSALAQINILPSFFYFPKLFQSSKLWKS